MMREKLFTKKELKERMVVGDEKIVYFDYNKKYETFTLVTNDNGLFRRYIFENETERDDIGFEYIPCYYSVFGLETFNESKIYLH